jgi:hypothetical protein
MSPPEQVHGQPTKNLEEERTAEYVVPILTLGSLSFSQDLHSRFLHVGEVPWEDLTLYFLTCCAVVDDPGQFRAERGVLRIFDLRALRGQFYFRHRRDPVVSAICCVPYSMLRNISRVGKRAFEYFTTALAIAANLERFETKRRKIQTACCQRFIVFVLWGECAWCRQNANVWPNWPIEADVEECVACTLFERAIETKQWCWVDMMGGFYVRWAYDPG